MFRSTTRILAACAILMAIASFLPLGVVDVNAQQRNFRNGFPARPTVGPSRNPLLQNPTLNNNLGLQGMGGMNVQGMGGMNVQGMGGMGGMFGPSMGMSGMMSGMGGMSMMGMGMPMMMTMGGMPMMMCMMEMKA